jgi:hypothetical protein
MWFGLPIVLQAKRVVDGLGSNNLTKVIMVALMKCGGLTKEEVAKKLLCFGVDGTFVFQGGNMCSKTNKG